MPIGEPSFQPPDVRQPGAEDLALPATESSGAITSESRSPVAQQTRAEASPIPRTAAGMLVSYSPVAMAKRAAGIRKMLNRITVSGLISIVISVALFYLFEVQVGSFFFWVLALSAVYSVVRIIVSFVKLKRARKATADVVMGPAFQIDEQGMLLSTTAQGERISWDRIRSVAGVNKLTNPGPRLKIQWDEDRSWSVPIIILDSTPSLLDSAFRAFSLGRFGLDLSAVDELW